MGEMNKEVLSETEKAKAKEQYSSETFSPAASFIDSLVPVGTPPSTALSGRSSFLPTLAHVHGL
jgi:hypothetical protein